jgi:RNA polymerase sigma-70 factor (ECF subfamily)
MIADAQRNAWFCREVLPLQRLLTRYIHRNWRVQDDVLDIRQEVYALALGGIRGEFPLYSRQYLYTIARNLLINRAKRARIVAFEPIADPELADSNIDLLAADRHWDAQDELRRVQAGLERLPSRCREIVWLRKVEGLTTREAADRLGVGIDTIERQVTMGMRALIDFMRGGPGRIVRSKVLRSAAADDAPAQRLSL